MRLNIPLLALVLLGTAAGASAQVDPSEKFDLKPLIPPVFDLPSNAQMKAGPVGRQSTPYTTAPLSPLRDNSLQQQITPPPGLRLTFPRGDGAQ